MSDATIRRIRVLQYIPRRNDGAISVDRLIKLLADERIKATTRDIQRDLVYLYQSTYFPSLEHSEDKPYQWYWSNSNELLPIPAMGPNTALTFSLADKILTPLLPKDSRSHLNANFKAAKKVLDERSSTRSKKWLKKVAVVPPSLRLISAPIKPGIYDAITDALFDDKILEITYLSRSSEELHSGPKKYQVHPYAIIHRDTYAELIGRISFDNKIRRWSLHRINKADKKPENSTIPRDFNLDKYIKGELAFPLSGKEIKFKARIKKNAPNPLFEMKLSDDQVINNDNSSNNDFGPIITATVRETIEFKWWILGLGDRIKVLEPTSLRDEIKKTLISAANLYK